MRKINQLIFHCTDSADARTSVDMLEIDRWHKDRGFKSPSGIHCGYHYVIMKDGSVQKGRPIEEIGAHAEGYNSNSIGVVWVGKSDFNQNQRIAAYFLFDKLLREYNLTEKQLIGHYEVKDSKTCPNLEMNVFRQALTFFRQHLHGGK